MRVSSGWLHSHGLTLEDTCEQIGHAQLSNYTATFRISGDGPPLILVPGLAGGIDLVSPVAKLLSKHFHVITYQLRGEEDCFALRRRFDMADLVEDLAEFIDWHGLERPHVLGISFGGVIGLEYAMRHPHRLASLSLQGVGAKIDGNLIKLIAGMVLSAYPLPADNAYVNQFFNLLFGRGPQPPELLDFVARHSWKTDQSVISHRFRMVRRLNLRPRLDRIRIPVLVMAAVRDVLISDASLIDLCEGIQNVRFVRLPKGGHLAFVVQPERIAEEVTRFAGQLSHAAN
jgi:pimeloyl-ACP methyl ester carboxylesterase